MRLKPDDNWLWYFDQKHDRLMLDISTQMVFRSRFSAKMLNSEALEESHFTLDDVTLFYQLEESCKQLGFSFEQRAELVLNGIVASRFLKPMLPKSWYFAALPEAISPQCADIVAVTMQDTGEHGILVVIEAGESASLCLVAQPTLVLPDRTLTQCDVIKVMNDRLIPVVFTQPEQHSSEHYQSEQLDFAEAM